MWTSCCSKILMGKNYVKWPKMTSKGSHQVTMQTFFSHTYTTSEKVRTNLFFKMLCPLYVKHCARYYGVFIHKDKKLVWISSTWASVVMFFLVTWLFLLSLTEKDIPHEMIDVLIYKEVPGMIKYICSIQYKGALYKTPIEMGFVKFQVKSPLRINKLKLEAAFENKGEKSKLGFWSI